MTNYYLAIDIGASSGRHILGSLDENNHISVEVIYRFKNGNVMNQGTLCWDYDYLFSEIIEGMKICKTLRKVPVSMGIDTWGVDFVLLDGQDNVLGKTAAYRDKRTEGADKKISALISEQELYSLTGIQKQPFNTIYQLWTVRDQLKTAERFLMAPEYFSFLLTGIKKNEYTNATTTGLVNAEQKIWDADILLRLGYPKDIFGDLHMPGDTIGTLRREIADEAGFNCRVIFPATHDTGSAVVATPLSDLSAYISSGTWSLMGIESMSPITTERSRKLNFTNEGGWGYRYRYLKNIMGLWMIQELHKEFNEQYSFPALVTMAEAEENFKSVISANDDRYLMPASMTAAIQEECRQTGQLIPKTPAQLAQCVFLSLAKCYAAALSELSEISGKKFDQINIVGGGCQNDYLNRLTAFETGLPVLAGPVEATALGNIISQMLSDGVFEGIVHARRSICDSFRISKI